MKKLLLTTLFAAVILPFFVSCQKSEQGSGTSNSASIVGQWQMTKRIEQYYVDGNIRGEETEYADAQNGELLEFRADYTFVHVVTRDGVAYAPANGTYVKTPEMIVLTYSEYTITLKIDSLTANQAVVIDESTSEDGGHVYKEVSRIYLNKL